MIPNWRVLLRGCLVAAVFAAGTTSAIAQTNSAATKHDPFASLLSQERVKTGLRGDTPAGIPGLVVNDLRLNGIVKSPQGLLAVVTSSMGRTYFLHEGAQLYDGRVEKIAMDGVSFHEIGKDAFGKPVERQVNKRIYSSAGEQQ